MFFDVYGKFFLVDEVAALFYVLIVRSHIGWRGEQSIRYKDVETSP